MGDGANSKERYKGEKGSVKRHQETDAEVGFNDNKGTSCRIGLSTICTSETATRPLNRVP